MRVIAGSLRARRLRGPKGDWLRPTSDRLRQTLFDILAPRVAGASFLDVFAGTGAVGIEALSRGAREAIFVDAAPEAARLIRGNLELCGLLGRRIVVADVFAALRGLARERLRCDIVFLDPPYAWQPYRDLADLLFHSGLACPGATVVFEHHHKAALPDEGTGYRRVRTVRQGDHALAFYEAADADPDAPAEDGA